MAAPTIPVPGGMEVLRPYLARLDGYAARSGIANELAARTGVHRAYVALGFLAAAIAFVFFGVGASLVAQFIGVAYPAYKTMEILEDPAHEHYQQWLAYWVVFGIFSIVETLGDRLLSWLPFYWTLKVAFLAFCMSPYTNGGAWLYRSYLRPLFLRHRPAIDAQMGRMWAVGGQAAAEMRGAAAQAAAASAAAAVEQGGVANALGQMYPPLARGPGAGAGAGAGATGGPFSNPGPQGPFAGESRKAS